jgi:ATP-dependent helicase HrpB
MTSFQALPSSAPLPIDAVLAPLRSALRVSSGAVLQAPPGAGKTTRVPLALVDEPWLRGSKLVMLEPRRLAARAAARRLADSLGEPVGATVGYRVRLDTRVGPSTRIEVVTEGVLTRLLQEDPTLEGIGLLVFDEFHERSLHADLGLALAVHAQRLVRADLRILVMSATLDVAPVARLLGDARVIVSEGREFPVATHYERSPIGRRDSREIETRVVATVQRALREDNGGILVFLPGGAEIQRVAAQLSTVVDPGRVLVAPLHGSLPAEAQDRAIGDAPPGMRKVVLATSIAETSLTIQDVRVVVDSGLARVPRFSARTGMTRLETVRVNRASADQRRGRAGRVAPGVCYRLWTEIEQGQLLPHGTPEILEADLAPLALELAVAGIAEPRQLLWLDPPPPAALAQGRELLSELETLDDDGNVTAHGRKVASIPLHPRLAHMLLRAATLGTGLTGCRVAALLTERDVLHRDAGRGDADLRTRIDALTRRNDPRADAAALRRVAAEAEQLARRLRIRQDDNRKPDVGLLVAFAYPDRIAQRRGGATRGRFLLRNGRGASIDPSDPLGDEPFIVIADADDRIAESRVYLAAPLTRTILDEHFASQFTEERVVAWDEESQGVLARRRLRLGAIVLEDAPLRDVDPAEAAVVFARALATGGIDGLPWSEQARALRQRLAFLHRTDKSWPDVSDAALERTLDAWLAPRIVGMSRRADVARIDLGAALLDLLSWRQRAALDELAPTHIVVPSGSRLPIDYSEPDAPVLAVRLQEMFGARETPRIAGGQVPLTLHLLSPAHRPMQVTRDLAGFWRSSYFDVRRDMRGRYPKHEWPEDPLAAAPTARAKPRR